MRQLLLSRDHVAHGTFVMTDSTQVIELLGTTTLDSIQHPARRCFSFTKDTSRARIGPVELVVKEKETVNFPQWLSIGAVVLGAVVLVMGERKS